MRHSGLEWLHTLWCCRWLILDGTSLWRINIRNYEFNSTLNCIMRNDTMKRGSRSVFCLQVYKHLFILFLYHKSTSLDIEVKTHWNTFLLFECVFPPTTTLSVLVVLYLFDSVPWIEEARQLGLVWKQCLEPIGMWNKSLRRPSSARSECPKAKKKVSVCFPVCSQCPCRVTASESSRGASWQQIRAVEEDNVCSLPGVHRLHEVVRIITILQTTCSEAQVNVVNMMRGYLTLLLTEWSRATPQYITFFKSKLNLNIRFIFCFFQAVNRNNSMFYVGWHIMNIPDM